MAPSRVPTSRLVLVLLLCAAAVGGCRVSSAPDAGERTTHAEAATADAAAGVGAATFDGGDSGTLGEELEGDAAVQDAGDAAQQNEARPEGSAGPVPCPAGEVCPDAAAVLECPGRFKRQTGPCPAGWTCFSPEVAPTLLCGLPRLEATDCEDAGGRVYPDPGDGSVFLWDCFGGDFIGSVAHGIEGAACCTPPRIDCGVCARVESSAFGCDGDGEQLWECTTGPVPESLSLLCEDLATGLPRYCCHPQAAPLCEPGT